MRALVDAFLEIRQHHAMLLAFLKELTPGNRRMGREFVFVSVRDNPMVRESRDASTEAIKQRRFRLAEPMSEFAGWAEEDSNRSPQVHILGEGRYEGFSLTWPGVEGRLVVAATGLLQRKATLRAVWLKLRFVAGGALDSSRVISGRF
ncbi:hypothetical protein GR183_07690 [Stappia sp. GBMRC 2046]|uniref:Uncharacterized protein n=1 Tax=Stappia sediminis TaxID=2692190 RepID=A0A7X3S7I3_9HYPH|nr:hypothetical protein [Stappia sediminis]MXN64785.1 hypothetical protein [Stappia sediminis]